MNHKYSRFRESWPFYFAILGVVQFFIISASCMIMYHGGNLIYNDEATYNFALNFFSDMGRVETFTGLSNAPIFLIFNASVFFIGLSTSMFFIFLPTIFLKGNKLFVRLSAILGFVAGLCFIGVALTPWDIYFMPHVYCVRVGFLAFLASAILHIIGMFRARDYNRSYAYVYMAFLIILIGYLYILFFVPINLQDPDQLKIHVIGQKVLLYSMMLTTGIQIFGASRYAARGGKG